MQLEYKIIAIDINRIYIDNLTSEREKAKATIKRKQKIIWG